jgi:hypothetical protein
MKIDLLILQLALLFLPGLIWAWLDVRYTVKAKPSDTQFLLRAFVFGVASYLVTASVYWALGAEFMLVNLATAGTQSVVTGAVLKEVFAATAVGFVLAIGWIYGSTHKLLTRFLQKIDATKTYGDEDVWDFTFNSRVPAVEYVHVRDFENKFVYAGWVLTFSESEKLRELVLRDVQVFDFESKLQYEIPLLYLARAAAGIHIEFPYRDGATGGRPTATGEET